MSDEEQRMNKRVIAALLGAAALAVPAAAVAQPGHGKREERQAAKDVVTAKGKGKKAKKVTFVFKGTFATPSTVEVLSGNAHVRKGGFVGQQVAFDFLSAKLVVADTNADQAIDITDVKHGDLVVVQARIPKRTEHAGAVEGEPVAAVVARKLIDRTNAPVEDADEATPGS
jgi:hypothetical protein